ncbi:hypothetical protein ACFRCI_32255 [Streptomyces sp. NPDC056638]|uniref:hypothetical protein n=1 Tax=Streptomyces sp. NPDC056638 TaxID=3345887 RepID=UPI003680A869
MIRLLIRQVRPGWAASGWAEDLLLDEPANHLALGLVQELEEALPLWQGALVVVSPATGCCAAASPATSVGRNPDNCSNEPQPI